MNNTLTIIDNYFEQAIHDKTDIVDVLDHILTQEANAKQTRAVDY